MSRTQPGAVVEIQGPLGKMSYPIPAYMNIQHDEAAQTYTLSVLDKRERKQREMWGVYCRKTICNEQQLTVTRNCARISAEPHYGCK